MSNLNNSQKSSNAMEKNILDYWYNYQTFEKSLELSKNNPKFSFYDGPPFATGLPHYGHIVASTIKDIIPRYKTQTGFYVERRFGWDTHGLPIEFEIEKSLGIKTRDEILKFGIENYNNECQQIVLKYRGEWRGTIERLGRWVDFDNDYKTMDLEFMESVWWVFKQLFDKNLIYQGVKVMPYSTACSTPLSNFEAKSCYKKVSDPSIVVKFKINLDNQGEICDNTYFLVWTTTPWTLPSNLALCVNSDINYIKIRVEYTDNQTVNYILGENAYQKYFPSKKLDKNISKVDIISTLKGNDLVGYIYEPLFNYFNGKYEGSFKIYSDNYVSEGNGTGIVHQAPAFGEDDYRVCKKYNIINKHKLPPCPLDANGCFTQEVPDWKGINVKVADKDIIQNLKSKNLLFQNKSEFHEYPFCWRSDTPLIYRAVPSWFMNVENIKSDICNNNKKTSWTPSNLRDGRFGTWLEDARDWCISRNRFWGTPIPIWISDDGEEIVCIGSVDELEEKANLEKNSLYNIHRQFVDKIEIPSTKGKGMLKRIDEVFDCWFESGAMPYASVHYPFAFTDDVDKNLSEAEEKFSKIFPGDFIGEGLDQTRGWFYTLMVLSTALFNEPAFKNVIVNGLVLASDGEKMSKSKKNYPDPNKVIEKYGSDALRLYLISTPIVKAESMRFKEEDIHNIVKNILVFISNSYIYYISNVAIFEECIEKYTPRTIEELYNDKHLAKDIDRWILQYLNNFIEQIHTDMDNYDLHHIVDRITLFIDHLSRWYIKLNKNRLKNIVSINRQKTEQIDDIKYCLDVLYNCFYYFSVMIAPFAPFLSEHYYQQLKIFNKLKVDKSVHFVQMPKKVWHEDKNLLDTMKYIVNTVEISRSFRQKGIKRPHKMPIKHIYLLINDVEAIKMLKNNDELNKILMDELNVLDITYDSDVGKYLKFKIKLDFKVAGKILGKNLKKVQNLLENLEDSKINNWRQNMDETLYLDSELSVTRDLVNIVYDSNNSFSNYSINVKDNLAILIDSDISENMQDIYEAKLIIRGIQELKKKAGLLPIDKIKVFFETENSQQTKHITKMKEYIEENIKNNFIEINKEIDKNLHIGDTVVNVREGNLKISFYKINIC